jgi:hypothetical protein
MLIDVLQETASDLAIAVAVVSSFTGVSARRDTAFIGEIGLGVCTLYTMRICTYKHMLYYGHNTCNMQVIGYVRCCLALHYSHVAHIRVTQRVLKLQPTSLA